MIKSIIQITAIILTLGASVFLIKSNFGLTPEVILKLSSSHVGYNSQMIKSLASQTADTKVGAILLFIAFICQLVSFFLIAKIKDSDLSLHGILISVGFCIIILTLAHYYSKNLSANNYNRAMAVYEANKSKK